MVIRLGQKKSGSSASSYHWKANRTTPAPSPTSRIRCSRGEWKARNQYSNRALGDYDRMIRSGQATPEDSRIVCREHTGSGQPTEYQCHGPCGRWKSIGEFSKSSRRNKKYLCKDCTDWHLADPEQRLPPPGAQLSPDELAEVLSGETTPSKSNRSVFDDDTSIGGTYDHETEGTGVPDTDSMFSDADYAEYPESVASSSYTERPDTCTDRQSEDGGYAATERSSRIFKLDKYMNADAGYGSNPLPQVSLPSFDSEETISAISTATLAETSTVNKNGWTRVSKPKNTVIPDYIKNDSWTDENNRFYDYESDDEW